MGKPKTKVITDRNTRWAYVNVWTPRTPQQGGRPLFSITLIIPKSSVNTIADIRAAMYAAYLDDLYKLKGNDKIPPAYGDIRLPLRDGDKERPMDPAFSGCWFLHANSTEPPGIVDSNLFPITSRDQVYSGVYGRASISFYGFNRCGNRGIACCLLNLQKIRDGLPLGTKTSAYDDFSSENKED